jgi:DNA excision repair protein ERCC-4
MASEVNFSNGRREGTTNGETKNSMEVETMKIGYEAEDKHEVGEFKQLPAMKTLGDLSEVVPNIVIDTREQTPLEFMRMIANRGTLTTGDYSFAGGEDCFAIERKSIADLVACCIGENRDRFERELHRMRGYWFKRLVICGPREDVENHAYRSSIAPKAVLNTVSAFEVRYEVPVVWFNGPDEAARQIEDWVWWAAREIVERANCLKRNHKRG